MQNYDMSTAYLDFIQAITDSLWKFTQKKEKKKQPEIMQKRSIK